MRRAAKCSAGVGNSAAISKRNKAVSASACLPAGAAVIAAVQVLRAVGGNCLPKSCALGILAASRVCQASSNCTKTSPCAAAASFLRANWAASKASRWARKAASPRRGPRSSKAGRSPNLSPERSLRPSGRGPRESPRLSPRLSRLSRSPGLRSPNFPPRPAGAGSDFFMPGRSSPRTAMTFLGAGFGGSTGSAAAFSSSSAASAVASASTSATSCASACSTGLAPSVELTTAPGFESAIFLIASDAIDTLASAELDAFSSATAAVSTTFAAV